MLSNTFINIKFFICLMLLLNVSAGQSTKTNKEVFECSLKFVEKFNNQAKFEEALEKYYKKPKNRSELTRQNQDCQELYSVYPPRTIQDGELKFNTSLFRKCICSPANQELMKLDPELYNSFFVPSFVNCMGLPANDFPAIQKTDKEIQECFKKQVEKNMNNDKIKDFQVNLNNFNKSSHQNDQENHDCFEYLSNQLQKNYEENISEGQLDLEIYINLLKKCISSQSIQDILKSDSDLYNTMFVPIQVECLGLPASEFP